MADIKLPTPEHPPFDEMKSCLILLAMLAAAVVVTLVYVNVLSRKQSSC